MKQRKLDFLSRRPVRATIIISVGANKCLIEKHLPENYLLDNGVFRFPAGHWENYFVDGKMYNAEGNHSLEEQKKLISKDLIEKGFTNKEIEKIIQKIEIEEGCPMLLTPEASNKWLRYHPKFEKEAIHILGKIKNEIQNETKTEVRYGMRKK